jgi:hypothetical protein
MIRKLGRFAIFVYPSLSGGGLGWGWFYSARMPDALTTLPQRS